MSYYSLVAIHGLGNPMPDYWVRWRVEEMLGRRGLTHKLLPLYYDDVFRSGVGGSMVPLAARIGAMALTPAIARPLAGVLADKVGDYVRDLLMFFFSRKIREKIKARFDEALLFSDGRIVVLAHSFGCVVARWYLSHNRDLARRVTLVEMGNPMASAILSPVLARCVRRISCGFPPVGLVCNAWSPLDPLSGRLLGLEVPFWNVKARVLHTDVAGYLQCCFDSVIADPAPRRLPEQDSESTTAARQ